MKLCWTKSYLPLSLLIRAVTGEDCSHFMFVFENIATGLVFQSNLLGTGTEFFKKDQKTWGFQIVHEIDLPMDINEERVAWNFINDKFTDTPYNFGGALYLGFRYILKRLFKIPLPPKNPWSEKGTLFCDQVYQILNSLKDPRLPVVNVMTGMDTPHAVYLKLKGVN